MTVVVVPAPPDDSVVQRLADDIGCSPWKPSWSIHTVHACHRDIATWIVPEVSLRRQITVPGEDGLTTYVIAVVDGFVVECTVEVPPEGESVTVNIRCILDRENPEASAEEIFARAVDLRIQAAVIRHMTWLRSATAKELATGLQAILPSSACRNLALILSDTAS